MSIAPPLCLGLPVHNGEKFLPDALASLAGQSFGDFQVVVSDNASTDRTAQICQDAAAADSRILYTRTPRNIGAGPNFNRAFSLCRSPFFKWMAHDDMLAADALKAMMAAFEADDGLVLVHSAMRLMDDDGRPLALGRDGRLLDRRGRPFHRLEPPHLAEQADAPSRFADALRRMNWCTAIFGIIRAHALRRTHLHGSYYEADRVLLAELALLGRFRQLDEPLLLKRCHEGVSVLKTYREQALMIDPDAWPGPKGLRIRLGYAKALMVGDLPPLDRAACAFTALRCSLRNRFVTRALNRLRHPPSDPGPAQQAW